MPTNVNANTEEIIPSTFKYTATMKFLLGQDVYDINAYSVKSIVVDSDYENNNMPLVFVTASISRKIIDLMVQNQDTGIIILDVKRCVNNSDMPDLFTDYVVDKFIYFISNDINKNDEQDYEGQNEGREDLFKIITIGLLSLDHVNKNKKVVNGVMTGKLSSMMYYLTKHLPVVIEPPTSNVSLNRVFVPPVNSTAKALEYLNSVKVFYDTSYRFFIDFDCSYLLSSKGRAVPRKGEHICNVLITLKSSYDENSKIQGMIIDEIQSTYKIDIDSIDCELADYHISDKSYSKVVATGTSGSSNNIQIESRSESSPINAKTRAIRIKNDNTGILNNMKSDIESSEIQLLVQKTDIDSSVLTMNKEYTIKADEVYKSSIYNGRYMLIRKREVLIREDDNFTMNTMLLFRKV